VSRFSFSLVPYVRSLHMYEKLNQDSCVHSEGHGNGGRREI
jgi:hypothetical protein